jgi:hypothetical protein
MNQNKNKEMQISEHELNAMTADLEEIHQATLPKMHDAIAEWAEVQREQPAEVASTNRGPSRRLFIAGAGVGIGGLLLAACSSSKKAVGTTSPTTAGSTPSGGSAPGNPYKGDLSVAVLAAALENTAVATYGAALTAAGAGKLGSVPGAVGTFITTAQAQHKAHAAAWNSILTGAGKPAISAGDLTVQTAVVTPMFAAAKTVADVANLALLLENVAGATYLEGISALTASSNVAIAATIQPVEMQHAAILNFVLGNYPVPNQFAQMTGARPLTDSIG